MAEWPSGRVAEHLTGPMSAATFGSAAEFRATLVEVGLQEYVEKFTEKGVIMGILRSSVDHCHLGVDNLDQLHSLLISNLHDEILLSLPILQIKSLRFRNGIEAECSKFFLCVQLAKRYLE